MNTRAVGGNPLKNSENNSRSEGIVVPAAAAAAVSAESPATVVPAETAAAVPAEAPALATSSEMKDARRGPGAPKGNRNAVRHGLYTAQGRARRAEVKALLASLKAAVKRGEKVLAKRKARAANPRKIRLVPGGIRTRSGQVIHVRHTSGADLRKGAAPKDLRPGNPGDFRRGEMP